jgi:hypothetical protein
MSYGQESDIDSRLESVSFSLPELSKLDEAPASHLEESSSAKSSRPSVSTSSRSAELGKAPEDKQHRASETGSVSIELEAKVIFCFYYSKRRYTCLSVTYG